MKNKVTIKRRIREGDKFVEATEKADLIKTNMYSYLVRLENGNIIKRKRRDVSWEK